MFETVSEIIKDRIDDPSTAIVFEDRSWSYVEYVRECVRRASLINALRSAQSPVSDPPAQFNIGILADNIPEFPMWLGAAALSRATLVGINPTRRGKELARDITHTNCAMIVTESSCLSLLDGLDLVIDRSLILDVDSTHYCDLLASHNEASLADVDSGATKSDLLLLIFTSGTSASPKAVICSQGRLALIGSIVAQMFSLTSEDVCYGAMPMFHSNALMANWCPTVAAGATLAMRRKFSASGFIQDVRAFQATYFNYVGKTLSYILATPQSPDDSENTLRRGFGNEGTRSDVEEFSKRFGCQVTDAYGSTEGGAVVSASPDTPHGALGPAPEGTVVLDPATGQECPLAQFDDQGRLINADKAIGELVNKFGSASFEGYWDNQDATAERLRDGMYWTGDLAYKDAEGFIYFAGRSYDWIRVDGENFAAAPVERIISRQQDVAVAAVYAVPDPLVGDQVMAALQLRQGSIFDPERFAEFLESQTDLGTKWSPKFIRISSALPSTESNKVIKRELRSQRWECEDPVWWKPGKASSYAKLSQADIAALRQQFVDRGREEVLDAT